MVNPYEFRAAINEPATGLVEDLRPASNQRLVVLLFLCSMSFVLYLDRICMAQAAKPIREEFKFNDSQMAIIMAAFTLAYALFEIPTGRMGDRWGARKVMTRIVLCWSLFTGLTAFATGFYSLLVVRFLFGAGEAGAYPNAARIVARWFPLAERGRAQAWMLASGGLGGMAAPLVGAYVIQYFGWRWSFQLFALAGAVWAVAFYFWFRDEPTDHVAVNDGELSIIGPSSPDTATHTAPIPWGAVRSNHCIWLLCAAVICAAFNSYLYFSWYPTYLREARGVAQIQSGWLSGYTLLMQAIGTVAGGYWVDRLRSAPGDFTVARRRIGVGCYLAAAAMLFLSILPDNAMLSALLAGLSCGVMMVQQTAWWTCVWQVSGKHIGSLSGLTNGAGGVGAIASQLFFGMYSHWRSELPLSKRAQMEPAMYVYVTVLLAGAICWFFVDPRRAVDDEIVEAVR